MGAVETIKQFGVPALPVDDFNRLAKNDGITWKADTDGDRQVDPNELKFSDGDLKKLYVDKRGFTKAFETKYKDLVELRRRESVEASLAEAKDIIIEVDFSDVRPEEKEMIRHLLKAGQLIEDLYHEQLGTYRSYFQLEGMREYHRPSFDLMTRNHGPECTSPKSVGDPFCNALPDFPEPKMGIYPADVTPDAAFCEELTTMGQANPALVDPMTVFTRGADGLLQPQYYHEAYRRQVWTIAAVLDAAAKAIETVEDEQPLHDYLVAAAESFRTGDWLESDRKWVALNMFNSKYAIRVAPDETYWDPCQNKAGFEFWFGRVNTEAVSATEVYTPHVQDMENELARLTPHFEPKNVQAIHVPDFVNLSAMYGQNRFDIGGVKGQMLPNWTYEEVGLKQWIMNDTYFTSPEVQAVWQTAAEALLHPDTLAHLNMADSEGNNSTVVSHELAHSLGIQQNPQVIDPKTGTPRTKEDGSPLTLRDAVGGRVATRHEELRAEISGLHFVAWGTQRGVFTANEQKARYVRQLMWALEKISHGMFDADGKPETYNQLAAVLLHRLFDHGAVTYQDGKFQIHFEKYPEVIETFLAEIQANQIHGDKAAIEAMYARTVDDKGQAAIHAGRINEMYAEIPYESYTFRATGLGDPLKPREPQINGTSTGCSYEYHESYLGEKIVPTEPNQTGKEEKKTDTTDNTDVNFGGCFQ